MGGSGGISPNHWGPYTWACIHLICLGAPESLDTSQQSGYVSFFSQLPYVIPCASCANHLLDNLGKLSVPLEKAVLSGREGLFAWSVELHNRVNEMLGKPTITVEKAKKHWMDTCSVGGDANSCLKGSRWHAENAKRIALFVGGILIGLALMWVALRTNNTKRFR